MEGDPRASRSPSHSSERPRRKHRAPSPIQRPIQGPHFREWTEERRTGQPAPSGAPGMSGAHHTDPAPQGTGAVSQRGEHPPDNPQDNPPLGPKQSSRGVNEGKRRERRSFHKAQPPWEKPAHKPEKKRKRKHSGKTQSQPQGQHLHGFDPREGPGELPPNASSKPKTPEGKGQSPRLGRKPAGPPPELEEEAAAAPAEEDQDLDPPTVSFEAYFAYDQPPASKKKRKSGKSPATALQANSLGKKDSTGADAEARESQKPTPPAAAGAPAPAPAACPALPHLGPCQPTDPPLAAFPLTSSFQPRPRALPSPRHQEGAGLMGISLSSAKRVLSGSKRARRRKMFTMFQECVQLYQECVYLLSQARGVPCSLPKPVLQRDAPEQLPRLEEHHAALASHADPLGKEPCQRALGKDTRQEADSPREPQGQDVAEQVPNITANRPKDSPAIVALLETGEAAAVQENVLPAPSPTTRSPDAPSEPARAHRVRPIPGKQVLSGHKKKTAPLMAKSIRDYKNWYYRRR